MTTTDIEYRDTDDLTILPPAQPMQPGSIAQLMQHAKAMDTAHQLAAGMCRTPLVPEIYQVGSWVNKDKDDDAVIGAGTAAILYGMELGLNPIQSLQQVFPVHGQPSIYARTAVALLKARGYRIWTESTSDESVTVMGEAPDGQAEVSTWTIERATKAGYVPTVDEKTGEYRKNQRGKLIGNEKYLTDPQGMLYSKASMEVCRKLAPDVLLGIGDRDDAAVADEQQAPRKVRNEAEVHAPGVDELRARMGLMAAPKATSESRPEPETPQAEDSQAGTPEPEVKKPTTAQNRALNALYERAGLTKDDKNGRRIVFASFFPDRDLGTPSADETDHVIGELEKIANSGEDDSVLVAFAEDVITQHSQAQQR